MKKKDMIDRLTNTLAGSQKEHYKSALWLLGEGPSRDGRSYLMATVFLQMAIADPKHWVKVFDHVRHFRLDENIQRTAEAIFNSHFKDSKFKFEKRLSNYSIRVVQQ